MIAVEYCCCAIPLVNAGIYLTLIEHVVASVLVGILAITGPSIVGASTPSFASWMLAIICFVVAALQLLGFLGVATGKEKTDMYRQYVKLHGLAILAAFSVAATWIVLSAIRHSDAKDKCIQDFFGSATTTSGGSSIQDFFGSVKASQGEALCNYFAWVDVVIMGVLWIWLAILQLYLFVILRSTLACQSIPCSDPPEKPS